MSKSFSHHVIFLLLCINSHVPLCLAQCAVGISDVCKLGGVLLIPMPDINYWKLISQGDQSEGKPHWQIKNFFSSSQDNRTTFRGKWFWKILRVHSTPYRQTSRILCTWIMFNLIAPGIYTKLISLTIFEIRKPLKFSPCRDTHSAIHLFIQWIL